MCNQSYNQSAGFWRWREFCLFRSVQESNNPVLLTDSFLEFWLELELELELEYELDILKLGLSGPTLQLVEQFLPHSSYYSVWEFAIL
jgi:hypothetical protein